MEQKTKKEIVFCCVCSVNNVASRQKQNNMSKNKDDNSGNQVNIELSTEVARGHYANLAMVAHSQTEFVVDFIQLMPGVEKGEVRSRIILAPEHAQRLLNALSDNIEKFEKQHGKIKKQPESPSFPVNFGGTIGEA